jgi:signal transduction histidine kinase
VTVGDDGRGLGSREERIRPGMGLTGMHERATLLGGRLRLGGRPGGGTRVRLSFPMEVLA